MTCSDLWDAETAGRYDDSSTFMFAPDFLDPAVDFLAELASEGPARELAIGTGRVARPLTQRGISVTGVELSQPMVDQLHSRVSGLPGVVSDMATSNVPSEFSLVNLVRNGIAICAPRLSKLRASASAARHLAPGGRFVIEPWTPNIQAVPAGTGRRAVAHR